MKKLENTINEYQLLCKTSHKMPRYYIYIHYGKNCTNVFCASLTLQNLYYNFFITQNSELKKVYCFSFAK